MAFQPQCHLFHNIPAYVTVGPASCLFLSLNGLEDTFAEMTVHTLINLIKVRNKGSR